MSQIDLPMEGPKLAAATMAPSGRSKSSKEPNMSVIVPIMLMNVMEAARPQKNWPETRILVEPKRARGVLKTPYMLEVRM